MVDRITTPVLMPIADLSRHDYQNKDTERFDKNISQNVLAEDKQQKKTEDFTSHLNKAEIQFVEKETASPVYDTANEIKKNSPYV